MDESILDKVIAAKLTEEVRDIHIVEMLELLMSKLAQRERDVVGRRFGLFDVAQQTLKEIGEHFSITRERVRQIESHALHKLSAMVRDRQYSELVDPVVHTTVHLLEEHGGIIARTQLWELIVQPAGIAEVDTKAKSAYEFILEYILSDRIDGLPETRQHFSGWKLHFADMANWQRTVDAAIEILTTKGSPMEEGALIKELAGHRPSVEHIVLFSHLTLAKKVRKNFFGEWGLSSWSMIVPRRVNDKIYLVLKKECKPLHFNDITQRINDAHFDHKVAYPSTVHNELILDKKYVLVGRGIYALSEWGYTPGVVADVIVEILRDAPEPLGRERILDEVLKRRMVRKSTVLLALTDRKRFIRSPDGRYALARLTPAS